MHCKRAFSFHMPNFFVQLELTCCSRLSSNCKLSVRAFTLMLNIQARLTAKLQQWVIKDISRWV